MPVLTIPDVDTTRFVASHWAEPARNHYATWIFESVTDGSTVTIVDRYAAAVARLSSAHVWDLLP